MFGLSYLCDDDSLLTPEEPNTSFTDVEKHGSDHPHPCLKRKFHWVSEHDEQDQARILDSELDFTFGLPDLNSG